jgi:hypothetical protein
MDPRDLAACARVLDGLSRKLERAQTPARGVSRRLCAQTDPTAVKSAAGWIPERPWTRTEASLVGPAGLTSSRADGPKRANIPTAIPPPLEAGPRSRRDHLADVSDACSVRLSWCQPAPPRSP